jgi:hypothetical protein
MSKIYRFGFARLEAFVPSTQTVGDNCSTLLLYRKTQDVARVFGREFFDAETPGRGDAEAYREVRVGPAGMRGFEGRQGDAKNRENLSAPPRLSASASKGERIRAER